MDRALGIFGYSWIALVVLFNLIGIAGMISSADTVGSGWSRVADTYSPFNVANLALNLALLLPAIGALYWRKRRREHQ